MFDPVIEREIELQDRVILASEDWAKAYKKNKESFVKLIKLEAKFEKIMRRYFKSLATERLDRYINWQQYEASKVKAYNFNVTVDIEEIDELEGGELMTAMHEPILQGWELGATTAEKTYNIELGLNRYSDVLLKATDKYVGKLVKNVNDTTVTRIQQSIATSLKLGEDITDAKIRLTKIIGDPKRAELIARTETVRSYSKGVTTFGKTAGYTQKVWEISSDPCEVCAMNQGAVVGIDSDFPSGDSEAPAHPRCRCGNSLMPMNESDA